MGSMKTTSIVCSIVYIYICIVLLLHVLRVPAFLQNSHIILAPPDVGLTQSLLNKTVLPCFIPSFGVILHSVSGDENTAITVDSCCIKV